MSPDTFRISHSLQEQPCQSYLENKTSGAMRMYWVYGPDQKDITIIGLEPHFHSVTSG